MNRNNVSEADGQIPDDKPNEGTGKNLKRRQYDCNITLSALHTFTRIFI